MWIISEISTIISLNKEKYRIRFNNLKRLSRKGLIYPIGSLILPYSDDDSYFYNQVYLIILSLTADNLLLKDLSEIADTGPTVLRNTCEVF